MSVKLKNSPDPHGVPLSCPSIECLFQNHNRMPFYLKLLGPCALRRFSWFCPSICLLVMFSYYLFLVDVCCSLKVLTGDFYEGVVFSVLFSASEGGSNGGRLTVSIGFGLVSYAPLAASHTLNSSSSVMSDGLMFCIGTTLTSETASCH